jgi:hypothetical protein
MTTADATIYFTSTASVSSIETKNTHKPGFKLTQKERKNKFDEHIHGLCVSCDTGLDNQADFICDPRFPKGFALMCNACVEYYNKNGYVSCGYGPFSNAMMK